MRQQVHLLVSHDRVLVSCGVVPAFAAVLPWLKARPVHPPEMLHAGEMLNAGRLGALLERVATPAGADLAVEFGLRHTRVGLVPPPPESAGRDGLEAYIRAWTAQMWNIDASAYVLRWDAGGKGLLASLLDQSMVDLLQAFADRRSLRLVSCKPAILGVLASAARLATAAGTVLQWTEPAASAARASAVQLAYLCEGELLALWRGWVPPPETGAPDRPLEQATERFRAAHNVPVTAAVRWEHWEANQAHALEVAST